MINILGILNLPSYYLSLLLGILECVYLLPKQAHAQLDEMTPVAGGTDTSWMLLQFKPQKQRVSLQLIASYCMNFDIVIQWIFTSPIRKEKEELSLSQISYQDLTNIMLRHYKKRLSRSQIYRGYEDLSTDMNYPIWRRQERTRKYVLQLASSPLRSNSLKMPVHPSICLSYLFVIVYIFRNIYHWQKRCLCKRSKSVVKVQGHRSQHPV